MISVITDPAVGGTFVSWTIHYLAGHENYYSVDQEKFIPLVDNPVTELNAHLFKANHPFTKNQFENTFNKITNQPTDNFHTVYFHPLVNHNVTGFDPDTAECIAQLGNHSSKVVLVSLNPSNVLYNCSYTKRTEKSPSFSKLDAKWLSGDERFYEFVEYFFADALVAWNKDTPMSDWTVWDKREFLALNIRPFEHRSILTHVDPGLEHYALDSMVLWNRFDQVIPELFEYLGITIDQERYNKWVEVYNQWKKVHSSRLMFVWYFDTIINYIITGRELNLKKFKLDLIQEAAIQHTLIYKHGLNLKTWQLEKFVDTKQLHSLLESNTHKI